MGPYVPVIYPVQCNKYAVPNRPYGCTTTIRLLNPDNIKQTPLSLTYILNRISLLIPIKNKIVNLHP